MTASEVADLVAAELLGYQHEASRAPTIGTPWSREKVAAHIEKLRACLVQPYLQRFLLADTYNQLTAVDKLTVEYWVVAVSASYCEFYDPSTKTFGLAELPSAPHTPCTVGVRGDLVGTFCAM